MELTVLLAGKYADNCQNVDFGDLVVNPRHIDVCILNAGLITEDYGVTENLPLWFKNKYVSVLAANTLKIWEKWLLTHSCYRILWKEVYC